MPFEVNHHGERCPEVCKCEFGTGLYAIGCPEEDLCETCFDGYHINEDQICEETPVECSCAHGTGVLSTNCTEYGGDFCWACDENYELHTYDRNHGFRPKTRWPIDYYDNSEYHTYEFPYYYSDVQEFDVDPSDYMNHLTSVMCLSQCPCSNGEGKYSPHCGNFTELTAHDDCVWCDEGYHISKSSESYLRG